MPVRTELVILLFAVLFFSSFFLSFLSVQDFPVVILPLVCISRVSGIDSIATESRRVHTPLVDALEKRLWRHTTAISANLSLPSVEVMPNTVPILDKLNSSTHTSVYLSQDRRWLLLLVIHPKTPTGLKHNPHKGLVALYKRPADHFFQPLASGRQAAEDSSLEPPSMRSRVAFDDWTECWNDTVEGVISAVSFNSDKTMLGLSYRVAVDEGMESRIKLFYSTPDAQHVLAAVEDLQLPGNAWVTSLSIGPQEILYARADDLRVFRTLRPLRLEAQRLAVLTGESVAAVEQRLKARSMGRVDSLGGWVAGPAGPLADRTGSFSDTIALFHLQPANQPNHPRILSVDTRSRGHALSYSLKLFELSSADTLESTQWKEVRILARKSAPLHYTGDSDLNQESESRLISRPLAAVTPDAKHLVFGFLLDIESADYSEYDEDYVSTDMYPDFFEYTDGFRLLGMSTSGRAVAAVSNSRRLFLTQRGYEEEHREERGVDLKFDRGLFTWEQTVEVDVTADCPPLQYLRILAIRFVDEPLREDNRAGYLMVVFEGGVVASYSLDVTADVHPLLQLMTEEWSLLLAVFIFLSYFLWAELRLHRPTLQNWWNRRFNTEQQDRITDPNPNPAAGNGNGRPLWVSFLSGLMGAFHASSVSQEPRRPVREDAVTAGQGVGEPAGRPHME